MVEEAKRIREEKVADLASKEAVLIQQESIKELKEKEKNIADIRSNVQVYRST